MSVGARVRTLRAERGHTLAELAGGEVSVALISKIERGLVSPSLSTLEYLARRLRVSPASLLEEDGDTAAAGSRDALARVKTLLLLGDPAAAAVLARQATEGATGPLRARLIAVEGEAAVAANNSRATELVLEGSALAAGETAEARMAQAELAFVLGLIERRRGERAAAQGAWVRCLEAIQQAGPSDPEARLLAARTQVALAGTYEVEGAVETGRQFLLRAAESLFVLSDPAAVARTMVDQEGELNACAAPVALGIVVAARRLAEEVAHDLARLERSATRRAPGGAPLEVSHSRHLL